MENQNLTPSAQKSEKRLNLFGYAVILAISFFILGNRWGDVLDQFRSDAPAEVTQGLPEDLNYDSVEELYDTLKKRYDGELDVNVLLDGLKEGLAKASGDQYTVYLNEEEAQTFKNDLNGTFTGIGAEIGIENERLIVVAPIEGFPAQLAGLRAQDVILEIDGEDTLGMSVELAVSKIRGEKGTDVVLSIFRDSKQIDITITRDEIVIPSVDSEILDGNIGYIRLSRFAEDTTALMQAAAQDFSSKKVNGIILDMRNNSGGFLDAAVNVLDLWVDNKVVVEQKRGDTVVTSLRTKNGAILADIPTMVLVNEGSASASEIVAGAMQDLKIAKLVGMQTYGKGSVQSLEELKSGGVLKVTIARWFTPNGNNIDEDGITPDEKVEFTEKDYEQENDPQKDKAIELLKS